MNNLIDGVQGIDLRDIYKNGEIYRNVSSNDALTSRYHNHIVQEFKNNQDRDYSYWHPSEFGTCGRKQIFNYYNYNKSCGFSMPDYVAVRSIEIFQTGHNTHFKFQNALSRIKYPKPILYGWWKCQGCKNVMSKDVKPYGTTRIDVCSNCGSKSIIYEEVCVENKDYNVRGHCDAIIKLSDEHEFQIVDFKTAGGSAWESIEKENIPKNSYIVQLNAYMWLLGINSGYIMYEHRDKMWHKSFLVQKDNYVVERIKHQLSYLNYHVAQGTVPPPNDQNFIAMSDVGPSKGICRGYGGFGQSRLSPCRYYEKCWDQQYKEAGGSMMFDGFVKVG